MRVVSFRPYPKAKSCVVITGRGPSQAGAGQLSALPLATAALMGKAGSAVGKALRLDEVGVGGSSTGGAEQMLTVGKRLTERLYLAFEQSLGGTENLLRLEMSLTERMRCVRAADISSGLHRSSGLAARSPSLGPRRCTNIGNPSRFPSLPPFPQ